MKRCEIGFFPKAVTLLLFMLLFIPVTGFSIYMAVFHRQALPGERLLYLAGAFLFGGLLVFGIYRAVWLGLAWVEYDQKQVFFHYSRKEQYYFRWEDIPSEKIQAGPDGNRGYVFCIRENGRKRKILLNRFSTGYPDFEKTLETSGVLKRLGIISREDFKRNAEQILRQFPNGWKAASNPVRPRPKGNAIPCPDCRGMGIHAKRVFFRKLNVETVCKTCGGSGYLPQ